MMSITLLFGLSSVGGASFNVPVSSRFCPSDVSYLIVGKNDSLFNHFGHCAARLSDSQEVVSIFLDVVDELKSLNWSLRGSAGACNEEGECNL
jgi:hypothetical protein